MRLVVSDANILIDMEAGQIIEMLFQLPMRIATPDILYYEEIEGGSPYLVELGLEVLEVDGNWVSYAEQLPGRYHPSMSSSRGSKPSHNDYLTLALARQEACTLLTGDKQLRSVAVQEGVTVMGTIGLLLTMVDCELITRMQAADALQHMKNAHRRLPWDEAKRCLRT